MTEPLEALNASDSMEFWGNKQPKCPHCGAEYDIDRHEAWELYSDDDEHEVDCGTCELSFRVRTITTHVFSTDEQDD